MHNKLLNVLSVMLEVPLHELPADASPDNVANWDSLKQINIVLAVEEEFDVRFEDADIPRLFGIRGFEQVLRERGVSAS